MEHLMACRICLATDVKLYDMCKYRLEAAYENLTGHNTTQAGLRQVCIYCGTMLNKLATFREKCVQSQQVLELLQSEHVLITTDHIKSINRSCHNMSLPYSMQFIQNVDSTLPIIKVETYEQNYDIKTDIDDVTEDFEYDRPNSDNSMNDIKHLEKFKFNNSDNVQNSANESDEEPLSKKVKKKKRKNSKHVSKYDRFIKTENDCDTTEDLNILEQLTNNQFLNELELEHKIEFLTKEEQIEDLVMRKASTNYQNSVYKCDSCYKGFMKEVTFKNHMLRHDPRAGNEICDICQTRWPDARSLRGHTRISHERKYICKICGHITKSSHNAKEHTRWHRGVTFACEQCQVTFDKSTSYLTHLRLQHPSSHSCDVCGESFLGENGLNLHRKKAHRNGDSEPRALHECKVCQIMFKSREALNRHSERCDTNLRPCPDCGEDFTSDALLKDHQEIHKTIRAVRTCPECSRTFANERTLSSHYAREHRGVKHHASKPRSCVCEICGSKCRTMASLVNHQRTHSGEKPFACTLCPKRFSIYQLLQIHHRTHTGERPFKCPQCPKAFKHKAALNRHIRVHTGAKPYTCPQCGKSFSQSNSMKQHCAGVHMKMYIYSRRAANKQIN